MSLFVIKSALGLTPHLPSFVCQSKHFETDWYRHWAGKIAQGKPDVDRFGESFSQVFRMVWEAMDFTDGQPRYRHRKMWEWCAIAQVLYERKMLKAGRRGCGFAVGHEPLPSLFAAMGADILATDLASTVDNGWAEHGQQSNSADHVYWPHLVTAEDFHRRVQFQAADMRTLAGIPDQTFDFMWSSCSLEHLGSLEAGMDFVEKATDLLRPGGVGVHTTEFNVSSHTKTLETGGSVIYRPSDLEALSKRLLDRKARLRHLVFDVGQTTFDQEADTPPYYVSGRQHIKLMIDEFAATSILLVVEKER